MNSMLNLFRNLKDQPKEVTERLAETRIQAEKARVEYEKLMQAYRSLVKHPDYTPIYRQAVVVLGINLSELLSSGLKCPTCVVPASRVKAITDIVVEPLDQVYLDSLTQQAEEKGEEAE